MHINFYSLQRFSKDHNFKNVCPCCEDGVLLMGRDLTTGELLPTDCCIGCGQSVIYDDIEEVREKGGWR